MSVVSNRIIGVTFEGDIDSPNLAFNAAENESSPCEIVIQALTTGNNTISCPDGATAVTIVPQTGNTAPLFLKGVSGDTGVALHLTDPSSVAISSAQTNIIIATAATTDLPTVRLIFS